MQVLRKLSHSRRTVKLNIVSVYGRYLAEGSHYCNYTPPAHFHQQKMDHFHCQQFLSVQWEHARMTKIKLKEREEDERELYCLSGPLESIQVNDVTLTRMCQAAYKILRKTTATMKNLTTIKHKTFPLWQDSKSHSCILEIETTCWKSLLCKDLGVWFWSLWVKAVFITISKWDYDNDNCQ